MTTTHPTDAGAAVHAVEAFHTALADQDLPTALTRSAIPLSGTKLPACPTKDPHPTAAPSRSPSTSYRAGDCLGGRTSAVPLLAAGMRAAQPSAARRSGQSMAK
jgi:hypothetical protein